MPDALALATEALPDTLRQILVGAHERRQLCRKTIENDDVKGLHDHIQTCRAATDGLEEGLGKLIRLRGHSEQILEDLRGALEDAEVVVVQEKRDLGGEYSSGRERATMLNAHTLQERRAVRRAERTHREVATALEYVRLLHRGADSTRRDAEVRLRAITVQSSLER